MGWALAGFGVTVRADPASSGWTDLREYRFNEAERAFSATAATGGRASQLGLALALLNRQPRTDAAVDRAAAVLDQLRAANPDDATGIAAHFFRARIEQVHRDPARPDLAVRLFRELAERHAKDPLGQQARLKSWTLTIFAADSPAEASRQIEAAAAELPLVTDPVVACDYRLLLGRAAQFYRLPDASALTHLLAAARGPVPAPARDDLWISIAELARENGRPDVAITYYRLFLRDSLQDARRLTVEERLAALEKPTR